MVVTNTQDDFKIRSIDVVHINPSILEGERGHSSILGPRTAIPIVRFAPTFEVLPTVSGDLRIPSVLTCNPGVVIASPTADIFYQWQADGVDIVGETNSTLITSLVLDDVFVTCVVDAVNFLGTTSGVSDGITPERVEPIVAQEAGYYAATGMGQETLQLVHNERGFVSTGMSADGRLDGISGSGMVLTGVSTDDRMDVLNDLAFVSTGTSAVDRYDLLSTEAYTRWTPTYLGEVPIINPSAESGDMTGWTVTNGIITSESTVTYAAPVRWDGGRYFSAFDTKGGANSVIDPIMTQVVDFDSSLFTDIDASLLYVKLLFRFSYYTPIYGNRVRGNIALLDINDNELYNENAGEIADTSTWTENWSELVLMPANTRKIQIQFQLYQAFLYVDAHVDDIHVEIYKNEHQP